jgi:hypothetical protein
LPPGEGAIPRATEPPRLIVSLKHLTRRRGLSFNEQIFNGFIPSNPPCRRRMAAVFIQTLHLLSPESCCYPAETCQGGSV